MQINRRFHDLSGDDYHLVLANLRSKICLHGCYLLNFVFQGVGVDYKNVSQNSKNNTNRFPRQTICVY